MNRIVAFTIAALLAAGISNTTNAKCASCTKGCADCATAADRCSCGECRGGPRCVGKAELVDVDKHCWTIECEEVCIPAVRFPWERGGSKLTLFSLFRKSGCGKAGCRDSSCGGGCADRNCAGAGCADGCAACVPPQCGFVRTVRDLKKETYQCQECEYSIEPAENGGPCANGASAAGECDACAERTLNHHVQPASATAISGLTRVAETKVQVFRRVRSSSRSR